MSARRSVVVCAMLCAAGCARHLRGPVDESEASDAMFLQYAGMRARGVIDMSDAAAQRASSPQVRALAADLAADQRATLDRVTALAARTHVIIPAEADVQHQSDLQRLTGMGGTDFDREYLNLMAADYSAFATVYPERARSARNRAVRSLASKAVPEIRKDLDETRRLANSSLAKAP